VDRITRKELKQDKFALEVGHTVEFLGEHRQQAIRYGTAALMVIVLVLGLLAWRRHQHNARQEALAAALEIQSAQISPTPVEGFKTFPTQQEKEKAAVKAFADVASRFSGSGEGDIATYYLGIIAAGQGNLAEAEKRFQEVVNEGSGRYAALAKLSLAEVYKARGKTAEGEKLLRSLIDKPNEFVSKEQATIALANLLASSQPAEARKLLQPLAASRTDISKVAINALSELTAK
jgi:predicted negative regulator of RcsB-dependent stress response